MSTKRLYILRWNPEISSYKEGVFRRRFRTLNRKNCSGIEMNWSIYEPDDLQVGDWYIFCRVGTANDGIVGLGRFTSRTYPGKSWRGDGRQIMYADMLTLMLQENSASGLWTAEQLERDFPEVNWHGGHAGVVLDTETTEKLALRLARDMANLPDENTSDVVLRRGDGGRFSVVCGLLSELCPRLLADVEASQEATNAMDETFIPWYRDKLTVDMARLKAGEELKSCVRLLDWTGVYSIKDFNNNALLSPKGAKLSVRDKFERLLALEEKYDNEIPDYWEMPKFKARVALFTEDLQATIDFLDNDCDGEMLATMSELWDDVSAHFQSWEFIDALRRCVDRHPDEAKRYNLQAFIEDAEGQLLSPQGEKGKGLNGQIHA